MVRSTTTNRLLRGIYFGGDLEQRFEEHQYAQLGRASLIAPPIVFFFFIAAIAGGDIVTCGVDMASSLFSAVGAIAVLLVGVVFFNLYHKRFVSAKWRPAAFQLVATGFLLAGSTIIVIFQTIVPAYSVLASASDFYLVCIMFICVFVPVRFKYAFPSTVIIAIESIASSDSSIVKLTSLVAVLLFVMCNTVKVVEEQRLRQVFITNLEVERECDCLKKEREASERLLTHALPPSISARLLSSKSNNVVDEFSSATIIFVEIIVSENEKLEEDLSIVNKLFSHFDSICETCRVEKIKSIGHMYLVASGIPVPTTEHAVRAVTATFQFFEAINSYKEEDALPVDIRIGMCTGPVIAGVVGKKRFLYDVFGDTVNTAARMVSLSQHGRILVTRSTHDALVDCCQFEEGQTLAVKGKGAFETFYVRSMATPGAELGTVSAPVTMTRKIEHDKLREGLRHEWAEMYAKEGDTGDRIPEFKLRKLLSTFSDKSLENQFQKSCMTQRVQSERAGFLLWAVLQLYCTLVGVLMDVNVCGDLCNTPPPVLEHKNIWIYMLTVIPLLVLFAFTFTEVYRRHATIIMLVGITVYLVPHWALALTINGSETVVFVAAYLATINILALTMSPLFIMVPYDVVMLGISIPFTLELIFVACFSTVPAIVCFSITAWRRARLDRRIFHSHLVMEQQRAHIEIQSQARKQLLLAMFPSRVCDDLMDHEDSIDKSPLFYNHTAITLLYADIQDFTKMCACMNPGDMLYMLNCLYLLFDAIVDEEHLWKITTIGDCYVVAGGMDGVRDPIESAHAVIRAVVKMQQKLEQYNLKNDMTIKLHLALGTGNLKSGILGRSKYIFDIFGSIVDLVQVIQKFADPGLLFFSDSTTDFIDDLSAAIKRQKDHDVNYIELADLRKMPQFSSNTDGILFQEDCNS